MRSNEVELNKEEEIAFDSKQKHQAYRVEKYIFICIKILFLFFLGKNQNLFMENYVENK